MIREDDARPQYYDGFTFIYDTVKHCMSWGYFDGLSRGVTGPIPQPPGVPEGREAYYVVLSHLKDGMVHMDAPFSSTFIDAFTYAEGVARSGFSGVMIRVTSYAEELLAECIIHLMQHYLEHGAGFVFTHADGRVVTHPATKPIGKTS